MHFRTLTLALCVLLSLGSPLLGGQSTQTPSSDPPLSPAMIDKVPELYRERARQIRLPEDVQKRYSSLPPQSLFSLVVYQIVQQQDGMVFLLNTVDKETDPRRRGTLLS
jgi:hypothetical protein